MLLLVTLAGIRSPTPAPEPRPAAPSTFPPTSEACGARAPTSALSPVAVLSPHPRPAAERLDTAGLLQMLVTRHTLDVNTRPNPLTLPHHLQAHRVRAKA